SKLRLARRAARTPAPMLDLKRDDRHAIYAQAELRCNRVIARARWQEGEALWRQVLDDYRIEQRFPFYRAGRAVEDNHAAVVIAVLEVAQLTQQIFQRFDVVDAGAAEIRRLAIGKLELADQHMRHQPRDVQVMRLQRRHRIIA